MRRMIPGKLIEKIKSLFTSLWSDAYGNVEIGKDLDVDGQIVTNGLVAAGTSINDAGFGEGEVPGIYRDSSGGETLVLATRVYADEAGVAQESYGVSADDGGLFYYTKMGDKLSLKRAVLDNEICQHTLTIKTGTGDTAKTYYATIVLQNDAVIDSPQDLTLKLGTSKKVAIGGTALLAYDSTAKIWKVGTESVTSVADSVTTI